MAPRKALRSQPYQMIYSADVKSSIKILTGETECDSYRFLSMDKEKADLIEYLKSI